MAMLSFGGIDVSKDRLDVMLLPEEECASVSNDAAGWIKLVEQLRGFSIGAIGLEASGGYERGVTPVCFRIGGVSSPTGGEGEGRAKLSVNPMQCLNPVISPFFAHLGSMTNADVAVH